MQRLHGTCVLISRLGVLLRGPSGSGKSDLALRLIDAGARLVADDQVELSREDGRIVARAPDRLAGLIEVRGIGILRIDAAERADVGLVVDLVPSDGRIGRPPIDRLPEVETETLLGSTIRRLTLPAFHASTPAKLRLAAAALARGGLEPVPPLT
ncbi:MAG TPA: HPr kinase/phosphatase C-terminal domain-containing protein [Arenibaculum sp.]|nr:HPr kinase/phosphatase C-terminal domain-containing protein [Arenibaculum sp.]